MYGKFIKGTAGYEINTLNLPTSWEYIYENRDILLKVDQFGPVYAQAYPPGDIMLFKREQHQKYSNWVTEIELLDENISFTNFVKPNKVDIEPENLKIQYLPECCIYSFDYKGIRVETEIFIPNKGVTIVYKVRIKNLGSSARRIKLHPHLIPYLNDAVIAPWDKYEWYLDTYSEKKDLLLFKSKLLSADANAEKRRCVFLSMPTENLCDYEISLEKYVGNGDTYNPDKKYTNSQRIYGYPPVYASVYEWKVDAGEEKELVQVFSLGSEFCDENYFDCEYYDNQKRDRKSTFDKLFSKNKVTTGDEQFDYYVNYWLPIQMNWVASLDRGWPTGMRGSRDSAQDYAGLLYSAPENTREIILKMMECQRSDGWFPRQYSAKGKCGKHDLRGHVDGGVFFVELVWKYLAHTNDYDLLDEQIVWLDTDEKMSALQHLIKAVEYYVDTENIGEHGLCKIREGDWLDAVNRAGMEGRGETVTVSAQTIMALKYLCDILKKVGSDINTDHYIKMAERIEENLNKYAFNSKGFYNGVFNDNGEWIFSECDPDGEERMYGVANYYAVISGVAKEDKYNKILELVEGLKCDKGYRLFYPYLGEKPIDKVGRIASGDVPPYLGENGNVYNHGSQGFLARALSVMGEGESLFETLKWIMPYDIDKHPTEKSFTPPYAIVNCWQQLPGFDHRGLMCFLTGSVAMAMRGVFEWMLGINPTLDGVEISPCLPSTLKDVNVKIEYMDKTLDITIIDGTKVYCDGKEITEKSKNLINSKTVWLIK